MGNQTTRPGSVGAGPGHTHRSLWNLRFLLGCLEIPLPPRPSESPSFYTKNPGCGDTWCCDSSSFRDHQHVQLRVHTLCGCRLGGPSSVYAPSMGAELGGPAPCTHSPWVQTWGVSTQVSAMGLPSASVYPVWPGFGGPHAGLSPRRPEAAVTTPKAGRAGQGPKPFLPDPWGSGSAIHIPGPAAPPPA